MNRTPLVMVVGAALALAACSSDKVSTAYDSPKPLDKMSKEEWCAYYGNFLTNPQLSAEARATDLQRMRARGCPMPS